MKFISTGYYHGGGGYLGSLHCVLLFFCLIAYVWCQWPWRCVLCPHICED